MVPKSPSSCGSARTTIDESANATATASASSPARTRDGAGAAASRGGGNGWVGNSAVAGLVTGEW